jgi:hypothetical protein
MTWVQPQSRATVTCRFQNTRALYVTSITNVVFRLDSFPSKIDLPGLDGVMLYTLALMQPGERAWKRTLQIQRRQPSV